MRSVCSECGRRGGSEVRLAALGWVREQVETHGDVLPRSLLEEGFVLEGQRVPLLGPQGIFKPKACELPISITTLPEGGPYDDKVEGPFLRYSYRRRGVVRRLVGARCYDSGT